MPIYMVIMEQERFIRFSIWKVLKSIPCDTGNMDEIDRIYYEEVHSMIGQGRHIQTMYFYREPDNPFKEVPRMQ